MSVKFIECDSKKKKLPKKDMKKEKESLNPVTESDEIADSIKPIHDKLVAAGFSRDRVDWWGGSMKPETISYSKVDNEADIEMHIIHDEEMGYPLIILSGDYGENMMQPGAKISLGTAIKLSKIASKFFSEYPSDIKKFMDKFADEYNFIIDSNM